MGGGEGDIQPRRAYGLLLQLPNPFLVLILPDQLSSHLLSKASPDTPSPQVGHPHPALGHPLSSYQSHRGWLLSPHSHPRLNSLRTELRLIYLSMPSTVGAQKGAL